MLHGLGLGRQGAYAPLLLSPWAWLAAWIQGWQLHACSQSLGDTLRNSVFNEMACWPPCPLPCSPPQIMAQSATSSTSGSACVAQPTNFGPFTSYNCTACTGGSCGEPVSCTAARRRSRSLLGPFTCGAGETKCDISGLTASTAYK